MEWTRGPTIGRGSSAVVSLAISPTGTLFAVKSTDLLSSASLLREESLISRLCSPFIVKCLGSDVTREENKPIYNLFLEYVPGGTLSDLIRKQGGSLDEKAIRLYARQMLLGLNYLHLKGLVHCDIKGQNILVGYDGLKIADFGCAKWHDSSATSAFSGTPAYMAPEVARGEEQGFPADIWALGCTIIEMATGSNPWPQMKDPASALYRIAFSGDVPEFPSWFSHDAKDFLGKCLMKDSKERRSAGDLLQHPFLNSVEDNCGEIRTSPTSVMDQRFWDAFEVSNPSLNPTETASSSDSTAGRIRDLIGHALPWSWNFPGWTEEEDWLTVRGDEIEECAIIQERCGDMSQDCENLIDAESAPSLGSVEDITETSVSMEDCLMVCFNGNSSIRRSAFFTVTNTESGKDVLCNFEEIINRSNSLSRSIFLQFFAPFL